WLASDSIRNPSGRNINEDRCDHLYSDQSAVRRNADAVNIRHVENGEHAGHALAGSDDDVGNQQPLQYTMKGPPNAPHVGRMWRLVGSSDFVYEYERQRC